MDCRSTYIPYKQTGYYSQIVKDYLDNHADLKPFHSFSPDEDGIKKSIEDRPKFPVNRQLLVDVLNKQYKDLDSTEAVQKNILSLNDNNTYTICTAHQPNLLTGYLYFIYKIAHVIQLANTLNTKHKNKHFVPVYFMGSEDNDLEELGRFNYNDEPYIWEANGQKGAVGRMSTNSLKPIINELFKKLGPPNEHTDELKDIISSAYLKHKTISDATKYLVDALFGEYGLIVFDPDEPTIKNEMLSVFKDDLFNNTANTIVSNQAEQLSKKYRTQAYPRPINLFYLNDGIRERIEHIDDNWQVLNSDISWTEEDLNNELNDHPEHFSPNVILRGLLQETILPNVAFVGGGAEVAYWLQLKDIFEHYNIFYPVVVLRQSILWINEKQRSLQEKLALTNEQLFLPLDRLSKDHIFANTKNELDIKKERSAFNTLFEQLGAKAKNIDTTLLSSTEAAFKKIDHQLTVLQKKMLRAEKKNMDVDLQRITRLKDALFPNGSLQERSHNFIQLYTLYGKEFINKTLELIDPLRNEFLIITNK